METKPPIPLAVLVGIQTPDVDDVAHEASLEELGGVVKTLGYEVVGTVSQKREGAGIRLDARGCAVRGGRCARWC
jgi:GTP-binding protein HflX